MVSKHAKPVALGGSHYYSQLDNDWHEAANILRRLSLVTYRLRWLDLEGCDWRNALIWDPSQSESHLDADVRVPSRRQRGEENWTTQSVSPGPNWNGAWERIETLVLSQGWVPTNISAIQAMPAGAVSIALLNYLKKKERKRKEKNRFDRSFSDTFGKLSLAPPGGIACEVWVEKEKSIRDIQAQLGLTRKRGNGLRIKVLYGWGEGGDDSEDEEENAGDGVM